MTASPEILSLADGRDIPVRIRHSRRARRILLHVGVYDGKVEIVLPPGASAPEVLINEVIDAFKARYDVTTDLVETAQENVEFKVPRVLRQPA